MKKEVPMMPEEFRGKTSKNSGYTKTNPRKWTKEEIDWMKTLKEDGYSVAEIAKSLGRTEVSISIKLKRLGKKENTYNQEHVEEKYETNDKFLDIVHPKSVLDLYCGDKSYYSEKVKKVITNDENKNISADYHLDALRCICELYAKGKKFDVVDLDPFGSAYDCFDLAIKMADKGLVVTLGEMGHRRWKRVDFTRRYYGIETKEDFTIDNMIKHIQMIGLRNKKILTPVFVKEWRNIGRVWFTISEYKVVEQWEKNTPEIYPQEKAC